MYALPAGCGRRLSRVQRRRAPVSYGGRHQDVQPIWMRSATVARRSSISAQVSADSQIHVTAREREGATCFLRFDARPSNDVPTSAGQPVRDGPEEQAEQSSHGMLPGEWGMLRSCDTGSSRGRCLTKQYDNASQSDSLNATVAASAPRAAVQMNRSK